MTPDYPKSRSVYRHNSSAYRLRNSENKLVLPQPHIDSLNKSFSVIWSSVVNNLHIKLMQATLLTEFESNLNLLSFFLKFKYIFFSFKLYLGK